MKKITIIEIGVILVAVCFLRFQFHIPNNNILNALDLSGYFGYNNVARAENNTTNSTNNTTNSTSYPIAFLAFMRTIFQNQTGLVNFYKPYILPGDYVSTVSNSVNPAQNLKYAKLFSNDTLKGVTYFSLAEIKNNIQSLKQQGVDFIGYDLERNGSPAADLSNPVGSMRNASEIVHRNNLTFLGVPGYPFNTNAYASKFAPYIDIAIIQAQDNQSRPDIYNASVASRVNALKTANPNIRIMSELSTNNGTLLNMEQSFSLVAKRYVDGVTVWTESPADLPKVKGFLEWYNHTYRQH